MTNDPSGNRPASAMVSFLSTAKAAVQLAARRAEKTKLTTITLPAAYRLLGQHCYASQQYRADFPDLFQQLDSIQTGLSEITSRRAGQPVPNSFGEKAKATAGKAMQAAQTQNLSMQQPSLFGRIGKVVYEKYHDASGPYNVITPIRAALARCEVLDAEIDRLSSEGTSWLTPKRLAVAGVGVALLLLGLGLWTITQQMFGSKNAMPLASYSALSPDEETNINEAVTQGDVLWETDEWLENQASNSRTAFSSDNGEHPSDFEFPALDMDERYKALVNRIRPGMTREQVESILSFSDEEKENDLGEFNSQKAGQILTILTWKGDGNSKPSIVLAFINNRLSEGGTPGYDITKGFHGK